MTDKETKLCTDECKHCIYLDEGDFICEVCGITQDDVTIVGWKPLPCVHPEKRRLNKDE